MVKLKAESTDLAHYNSFPSLDIATGGAAAALMQIRLSASGLPPAQSAPFLYPLRVRVSGTPSSLLQLGSTPRLHRRRRARAQPTPESMVAPATLSLRPYAAPAPPRTALPRSRACFAPGTRTLSPSVAVSHPPRHLGILRRAVAVDSDQQGSPDPPEQVRMVP
jgi:hypothetical protein